MDTKSKLVSWCTSPMDETHIHQKRLLNVYIKTEPIFCEHWETKENVLNSCTVPYSRKLSRKKTFMNFVVLWLFVKVFAAKFGGMASFGTANEWNIHQKRLLNVSVYIETEPLFCEHQETKESVLNRGISCTVCQTTSVH